ncbi:ParA family protein [Cellulomonas hominis]|uniref:ParA family protein n=1 Tax=Cellulomonas hominis TaxID=156981 RepID=UPI001B9F28C0|nr:ParA family protein [Cellulomonas hominis]VTR77240.1 Sporulation initiation inhibitor protein Soj [Cellulomonas hominis]
MALTASIANNKGGVYKTGTTVQLAAGLARRGLNVLVVDLDPQANASRRLGVTWDPSNPTPTMSEVIAANADGAGAGAVVACGWGEDVPEAKRIDVLPARFDLGNRENEAGAVGAVRRVRKALRGWTEAYDVVLIDTRPDLGHLVQMAFAAADTVLIVTSPEYDPVEGAVRVRDFVSQHAEDIGNDRLTVGGVIVTMRRNTSEQNFQLEGLLETFGDLVWDLRTTRRLLGGDDQEVTPSYIPMRTRFSEADSAATSLSAFPRDATGLLTTAIFDQLAARFAARLLEK